MKTSTKQLLYGSNIIVNKALINSRESYGNCDGFHVVNVPLLQLLLYGNFEQLISASWDWFYKTETHTNDKNRDTYSNSCWSVVCLFVLCLKRTHRAILCLLLRVLVRWFSSWMETKEHKSITNFKKGTNGSEKASEKEISYNGVSRTERKLDERGGILAHSSILFQLAMSPIAAGGMTSLHRERVLNGICNKVDSKAGQGAMGKAPAASPDIAEKEKKKIDSVMLQEVVRKAEDISLNCERVADRTQTSVERSAEDTQSPSFPHNATEMDELDEKQLDDALLYLRCHVRLGHLPRNKMFALAAAGHLPKRILRCNPPLCPSCQFGRQTRKSFYRKKGGTISGPHKVEKVGDLVHVDQIEQVTYPRDLGVVDHPSVLLASLVVRLGRDFTGRRVVP